jgi:hypothetical protein
MIIYNVYNRYSNDDGSSYNDNICSNIYVVIVSMRVIIYICVCVCGCCDNSYIDNDYDIAINDNDGKVIIINLIMKM